MRARIKVMSPGTPESLQILESPEVVIGRGADCQIVLADGTVSRKHCLLKRFEDGYRIIDLSQRNGTTVNGLPCGSEPLLRSGDLIRAGNTTILYVADFSSESNSASPESPTPGRQGFSPISEEEQAIYKQAAPKVVPLEPAKRVVKPYRKSGLSSRGTRNRLLAKLIVFLVFGVPFLLFDLYVIWVFFLRDAE